MSSPVNTYKLTFSCMNAEGDSATISFNYADPTVTAQKVQNVATAIATYGGMFATPITMVKSVQLVQTSKTVFDNVTAAAAG